MSIKPIGDRVLVKPREKEEKTKGGIFIPETAQDEKINEGTVISVGDDKESIKVKKNDRVIYDKYAGTNVTTDGEDYLIIKNDDILAVIE